MEEMEKISNESYTNWRETKNLPFW